MVNCNLNEVLNEVIKLGNSSHYERNIEVFLVRFAKKNQIYKQESNDKTKSILYDSLKNKLAESRFLNREIIDYDAVISKKNTHELVTISQFPNIGTTLVGFKDESTYLTSTSGLDESKFHMYMVKMRCSNHVYMFFGNYTGVLELQKKYLFGKIINPTGNFKDSRIDFTDKSEVFGFNKKIEMLVIDEDYILINQAGSKFESLFKMSDLFSAQATHILNENPELRAVFSDETRKSLLDKVKNGKRMATRLIKITSDRERFVSTIKHIDGIQDILNNPQHSFYPKVKDVKYQNGRLSTDPGNEIQLLNAISDALYQAVISKTENVDPTRM